MILSKSFSVLTLLLFSFLVIGNVASAYAQEKVEIRGSDHDGYSRLVFEWPASVTFNTSKSDDKISIDFGKAAGGDASSVNAQKLRNIGSVSLEEGDGLKAIITVSSDSKFRDFKIGKRVILDVYDSKGSPERGTASNAKIETNNNASNVEETQSTAPSNAGLQNVGNAQATNMTTEVKITGQQPHLITISSTESIGMAAFERAGFFWMVFDKPELTTPPIVSGPSKTDFPPFEKIDIGNKGVAYRMPKIDGYYMYGEGGGILWRVVLTPTPRDTKAIAPTVTVGSNLLWPMQAVTQIMEIEDPIVGDVMQVSTVADASNFAGTAREYVELETFSSPIGLAFAPRADNITAQKTDDGLLVSKPNGLAVSPIRDTAAVSIKDDLQKENTLFNAQDNPDNIKRIYDFGRWEMGGLRSLDNNRQILMAGLGVKKGAAKAEDLLTLTKLNIANDRGPEALGLLRIAAQELPGIDETPEYISLRAAASALTGRFSESLKDFATPSLASYDETNYWKAFALTGVEDWIQADSVMPNDLRLLNAYPQPIKEPLSLALAEAALRAGKVNKAQDLLMSLEPEFAKMSLARQSAWKYLNGELEHQKGNFDSALDNWTPLLTGADDYYRAKAGLSVTRMQLERQKITPEKAIDRLEGLRYAWRGDELESLVNYRLGEVYIANKDYLKGLSVLRNAVSISPNAKVTEEITNYMTSTFRKIFTDGELEDVSPIDAVSIYEEFKELTPIGAEGDLFVQNLAERLVEMDLLGRAASLLDHQVTHRLKGEDKAKIGIRLAAIRLLNNQPDGAIAALTTASNALREAGGPADPFKTREIKLLQARALSKVNRSVEAINILKNMKEDKDVIRLRADIAWGSGQWDVAASAFQKLIRAENISKKAAPSEYGANLIVNRGIALNLSGNRTALDNLRAEYDVAMKQSDKAQIFDLVTRPRKLGMLDNRQSISSLISEVDMFGDFLENYKTTK